MQKEYGDRSSIHKESQTEPFLNFESERRFNAVRATFEHLRVAGITEIDLRTLLEDSSDTTTQEAIHSLIDILGTATMSSTTVFSRFATLQRDWHTATTGEGEAVRLRASRAAEQLLHHTEQVLRSIERKKITPLSETE